MSGITLTEVDDTTIATPPTGKATVFLDDVDGPAYKDDTGAVTALKGDPGPPGEGVPAGGTAGQVLEKIDGTDYNTQWADAVAYTGTAGSITLTGSAFSIDTAYVGQASITTLGTITTGTWNADAIAAVYGGTGNTGYAVGDILYAATTTTLGKLAAGADGEILTLASGVPTWAAAPAGFVNPMTTEGDIITGGTSGVAQRLGIGSNGDVLTLASGVPSWAAPTPGGVTSVVAGDGIDVDNTDPDNPVVSVDLGDPLALWDFWQYERIGNVNVAALSMFLGAPISTGTNTTALPAASVLGYNQQGAFLRSSTTANGGYRYQTSSLVGDYFGVIPTKFRCQFLWRTDFTGRTVRMGGHDSTTSTAPVDGAYFEVVGDECRAVTANNSTRTTNATTVTLSLDTPYTFDIDTDGLGNEIRFRVYAGTSNTPILNVTNTTNIPTSSARAFGWGIVATESSTTASDIGVVYGIGLGTVAGFEKATASAVGGSGGTPNTSAVTALSISSGTVTMDLSLGDYFTLIMTENVTTLTLTNPPGTGMGMAKAIRIQQDSTGGRTLALPASFKATGGSDTSIQSAANAYTLLAFTSMDQGTRCEYAMKAAA